MKAISEQRHLGYFARLGARVATELNSAEQSPTLLSLTPLLLARRLLHIRSNWTSLRVSGVKKPDLDFGLAVDLVELRLIALLTFFSV